MRRGSERFLPLSLWGSVLRSGEKGEEDGSTGKHTKHTKTERRTVGGERRMALTRAALSTSGRAKNRILSG